MLLVFRQLLQYVLVTFLFVFLAGLYTPVESHSGARGKHSCGAPLGRIFKIFFKMAILM